MAQVLNHFASEGAAASCAWATTGMAVAAKDSAIADTAVRVALLSLNIIRIPSPENPCRADFFAASFTGLVSPHLSFK